MSKGVVLIIIAALMLVFMSGCLGGPAIPLQQSVETLQVQVLELQQREELVQVQIAVLASTTVSQVELIEQQRSRLDALTHDVFLVSDKPVITEADAICLVGSTMIQNITEMGKPEQAIFCGDLELLEDDGGTRNSQRGSD